MNNEETKKKMVKVLQELRASKPIVPNDYGLQIISCTTDREIADALIAAGIGDVKRHRVFVSKDGKEVKQFYSGEEVENILKERKELKDELRSKVEYIHEQDEVIKEYKHRAARAERALRNALNNDTCYFCNEKIHCRCEHRDWGSDECIKSLLQQAEKELAEERKDD